MKKLFFILALISVAILLQAQVYSEIPPVITTQPQSVTAAAGSVTNLSLVYSGSEALIKWMKDGQALPGAIDNTNTTLIFSNVQPMNIGDYQAIVSNGGGSVTSSVASLSIPGVNSALWQGLVAYYPLNGNANDVVGTNNGSIQGGAGFTNGVSGESLAFTNADAAVFIPASTSLDVGKGAGLTLSVWIKPTDITQGYPLFEWNHSNYFVYWAPWGVHFWCAPGQPTTGSAGPGGPGQLYANILDESYNWHQLGSAGGVVNSNGFQHVVLTYDSSSGVATIYYNGQIVSQANLGSFIPQTSYDLYLGRRISDGGVFSGLMDEAMVFSRALTASEVSELYLSEVPKIGPAIVSQPLSATNKVGDMVALSVTATGSDPLIYQWLKEGTVLAVGTNATLLINSAQLADSGNYTVMITNAYGSVTSSVAALTVIEPLIPGIVTLPAASAITYGQTLSNSVLSGGAANVSGTFTFAMSGIAPNAGTTNVQVLFMPEDSIHYGVVSTNIDVVVDKAIATVALSNLSQISDGAEKCVSVTTTPAQLSVGITYNGLSQCPRDGGSYVVRVSVNDFNYCGAQTNTLMIHDAPAIISGPVGGGVGTNMDFKLSVSAKGEGPLSYQWYKDGQPAKSGFDFGLSTGTNDMAVRPDGKLVLVGSFTSITNKGVFYPAFRLAQINTNGLLDTNFYAAANSTVSACAVQSDGKILIGGGFTLITNRINGTNRTFTVNRLARLWPDGMVDTNFIASPNSTVSTIALQSDGGILIGGAFTTIAGIGYTNGTNGTITLSRSRIARLLPSAELDTNFTAGVNSTVNVIKVQSDDRILLGGLFTLVTNNTVSALVGSNSWRIARLSAAGQPDTNFSAKLNSTVSTIATQADGGTILGGSFTLNSSSLGIVNAQRIGRMTPQGQWDTTNFMVSANSTVNHLCILPDGSVLVGGVFTALSNIYPSNNSMQYVGKLNSAGFVTNFAGGANGSVSRIVPWHDGTVVMSGAFTSLSQSNAGFFSVPSCRLGIFADATGALMGPSLSIPGFSQWDQGQYYVVITGPYGSVTSSVVSLNLSGPPKITSQPQAVSVNVGGTGSMGVTGTGNGALSYQWFKAGAPVVGATNSQIAFTNATIFDAGDYSVAVSDQFGSIISSVAALTVNRLQTSVIVPPSTSAIVFGQTLGNSILSRGTATVSGTFAFVMPATAPFAGETNVDVVFNPEETNVYEPAHTVVSVQVKKAQATVVLGDLVQIYDGSVRGVSAVTVPDHLAVNLAYDGGGSGPVNAGGYGVVGTITDLNYEGAATNLLTILRAPVQVTLNGLEQVYDGTEKRVTASTAPGEFAVTVTYNGAGTAPVTAGNYEVIGTVSEANYAGVVTNTLAIKKAEAQVMIAGLDQTYDGTAKPVSVSTIPSGLTVGVTYDGSAVVVTNPGSYRVVASIAETNYQGKVTNILVISSAAASVTLTNLTQIYSGTNITVNFITDPTNLNVVLTYNGDTNGPINAGSYTVIGSIAETNYVGSVTNTLVINKTNVTVVLGDLVAIYDGNGKTVSATTVPGGLNVGRTYNGSNALPVNAGSYTVIGTINETNYQGSATNTLVVNQAAGTVTLSNLTQYYTGNACAVVASTMPGGLAVDLSYNSSASAPTNLGSYTVVGRINATNYVGGATNTLVIQPVIPYVITQPISSQTAVVGTNVSFIVAAGGTGPLSYQWQKDGSPLIDGGMVTGTATSNLLISVVAGIDAGSYSVVITNASGSVTSGYARLNVNGAIYVVGNDVVSGSNLILPVKLKALGTEISLQFSLGFNPNLLTFVGVDDPGVFVTTDTSLPGRIGLTFQNFEGYLPGEQLLLNAVFQAKSVTSNTVSAITFQSVPFPAQVIDYDINVLTNFTYLGASITVVPTEYGGDVFPRPVGDFTVDLQDWAQIGKFVVGSGTVTNADEMLRADCAPRNNADGVLTVADWVQAGRYAAHLDPLTVVNQTLATPKVARLAIAQGLAVPKASAITQVQLIGSTVTNGQTVTVPLNLVAIGVENALGYNVTFNPTQLSYRSYAKGTNAGATVINVNTNQTALGRLGMAISLNSGNKFNAGTNQLALLSFVVQNAAYGNLAVNFAVTNPVVQQVCDTNANVLGATFTSAIIVDLSPQPLPAPTLLIQYSNGTVNLVWPQIYSNYLPQSAGTLGWGLWNSNLGSATISGTNLQLTLPATNPQQFYRLSH
jgi:hypothetical protein